MGCTSYRGLGLAVGSKGVLAALDGSSDLTRIYACNVYIYLFDPYT
jgi:hypothetical protein